MRLFLVVIIVSFLSVSWGCQHLYAGNPERAGQAGAAQLLVNPYARSAGVNGINVADSYGIESAINNVAGLAHTTKTEVIFAHTLLYANSGIRINTLGFSQRLGEAGGVIGLSLMSFNFGDIPITTIENPDGNLGTFSPTFLNIGVSYAREMVADRIFLGFTVKIIHESIPDASSNGVGVDGGVQYRSKNLANGLPGKFRLGVALRNVGPEMRFNGDGMSLRLRDDPNSAFDSKFMTTSASFELPTVLMLGASYRFYFGVSGDTASTKVDHTLIPMFTFISNSFARDQYGFGLEYSFREMLMLRACYLHETNIMDADQFENVYRGIAAGVSVQLPFGKEKALSVRKRSSFAVDYSIRPTHIMGATHNIGLRINL
jgi:hypothetical protein